MLAHGSIAHAYRALGWHWQDALTGCSASWSPIL
jgi:hypothetical protein